MQYARLGRLYPLEKGKGIAQQAKLPVGIRHLRGVDARSGLSGEAPRGDLTPSKPFLGVLFFFKLGMPRSMCLSI